MSTKRLNPGDCLYAEGSWNNTYTTIVAVDDEEAISNNGYRFRRNFTDGDMYLNKDLGWSMDFNYWYLKSQREI